MDPIQGEDMTLTNTLLTLIEDQRNGESIDQELVRKVANSLSALGIDEENSKKNSLAVYKEQLEKPYMVATSKYFTTTLEASITEGGAIAFLEKARKVFVAEEERTIIFIRTFGRNKFIENCARDVLRNEQIWTGFHKAFGDAEEEEDVRSMHSWRASPTYWSLCEKRSRSCISSRSWFLPVSSTSTGSDLTGLNDPTLATRETHLGVFGIESYVSKLVL